jgi:hypothetical protein
MASLRNAKKLRSVKTLPRLEKVTARKLCLREEIDTPDLTMLRDFSRFYITTSHGKIEENPLSDSVN